MTMMTMTTLVTAMRAMAQDGDSYGDNDGGTDHKYNIYNNVNKHANDDDNNLGNGVCC